VWDEQPRTATAGLSGRVTETLGHMRSEDGQRRHWLVKEEVRPKHHVPPIFGGAASLYKNTKKN